MPITPFIGVRISWLMLARNSDFAREASTACASARRRSVMSVPVAITCVISPFASTRHVLNHASWRSEPSAAIHSSSNEIGKSPAVTRSKTPTTASRSCSATSASGRPPFISASVRPVSCSHARLKRSIVPSGLSTITRLPAVSMIASENAPASRARATSIWIDRPVSAPTVTNSTVVRQLVFGYCGSP